MRRPELQALDRHFPFSRENVRLTPKSSPAQRRNYCRVTQQPTSPQSLFPASLNGPSVGALLLKEGSIVQCPNEPNIIGAITSWGTRKGEVGLSKFIPIRLICPFFDELLFV